VCEGMGPEGGAAARALLAVSYGRVPGANLSTLERLDDQLDFEVMEALSRLAAHCRPAAEALAADEDGAAWAAENDVRWGRGGLVLCLCFASVRCAARRARLLFGIEEGLRAAPCAEGLPRTGASQDLLLATSSGGGARAAEVWAHPGVARAAVEAARAACDPGAAAAAEPGAAHAAWLAVCAAASYVLTAAEAARALGALPGLQPDGLAARVGAVAAAGGAPGALAHGEWLAPALILAAAGCVMLPAVAARLPQAPGGGAAPPPSAQAEAAMRSAAELLLAGFATMQPGGAAAVQAALAASDAPPFSRGAAGEPQRSDGPGGTAPASLLASAPAHEPPQPLSRATQ
jgi:hypothetical protein